MGRKGGPPAAPSGGAVPEWALTYGDLMSLLLTFFILMFAFSEIRKPKFDMAIGSLRNSLGRRDTPSEASNIRAREASGLRPQAQATTFGDEASVVGDASEATIPDRSPQTTRIADGRERAFGIAGEFSFGSVQMSEGMRRQLSEFAERERGHQGRIEVRGHAGAGEEDPWTLGMARARAAMEFLVDPSGGGLAPERFRLSSGGLYEVGGRGADPVEDRIRNRRVEIFVTQQRVTTPER